MTTAWKVADLLVILACTYSTVFEIASYWRQNRAHKVTTNEDVYETIARLFHEAYEELAPQYGYDTRKESAVPWAEVPENNRNLMIATVGRVFEKVES